MSELYDILCQWRHKLHRFPETAFEEKQTAAFIAERMREMGYEVCAGIGGTGVVASMKLGSNPRCIGLRADMDAISLEEKGSCEYCSQIKGKMHGCGHDGHVTQLLGAAKLLSERKNFDGTVRFVFQPAEEPGKGAKAMLEDGFINRFPIDELYGLHNMPSLPEGTVHTRTGGIMASEDNFTIRIKGRGGHASSPHLGIDPLVVGAHIILGLQNIASRSANPLHPVVVSCTELVSDGAHNAIPGNVIITGDTRSSSEEDQLLIEKRMREICAGIAQAYGAECEVEYTHEFSPTVNWAQYSNAVSHAAAAVVGKDKVFDNCEPWMASEDFGTFLEKIPGCFFFLGAGKASEKSYPLHNAYYDYNDKILVTGSEIFAELVHERLLPPDDKMEIE